MLPTWLELIERDAGDFNTADLHKARPFDYSELLESRIFISMLTFLRSQRFVDNQLRKDAIEKNQELIQRINKELNLK